MTVRVLAAVPAKADSEVLYGRARRGGPPGPGTCRRNSVSARAARAALAKSLESFNGTVPGQWPRAAQLAFESFNSGRRGRPWCTQGRRNSSLYRCCSFFLSDSVSLPPSLPPTRVRGPFSLSLSHSHYHSQALSPSPLLSLGLSFSIGFQLSNYLFFVSGILAHTGTFTHSVILSLSLSCSGSHCYVSLQQCH